MHIALYREFRPAAFDEMIGQDHIVRILKNQIKTGNTGHAYLFSGTRGTGKTTAARILAKALNCTGDGEKPCCRCESCRAISEGSYVDVIEMDAASNRSVHDIQSITDSAMYAPTAGRYKVYIIDEVHMLSTDAFNALLKTLEEPPAHVVFILATTEPQKVPATILSRCMKLDFRRVSEKNLVANMRRICGIKQIEAEEGALSLIAVNADGSVRDSLSILEQCISPGEPLRRDDVASVLGTAGVEPLLQLTDRVLGGDPSGALMLLNEILSSGSETKQFMKEWLGHFRNLLIAKYVRNPADLLNMSGENAERVAEQSGRISQAELERAIRELTETISLTRWASHPRVMLEMSVVKLSSSQIEESVIPPQTRQDKTSRNHSGSLSRRGFSETGTAAASAMKFSGEGREIAQEQGSSAESVPAESDRRREQTQDVSDAGSTPVPETEPLAAADWDRVVNIAADSKGLLTRLAGRTHVREEKDGNIYVACDDETTAELLKGRGKETVERILEQEAGRHLNIIVETRRAGQAEQQDLQADYKSILDQYFGMDVPVK